jgi:hypothetical protein
LFNSGIDWEEDDDFDEEKERRRKHKKPAASKDPFDDVDEMENEK